MGGQIVHAFKGLLVPQPFNEIDPDGFAKEVLGEIKNMGLYRQLLISEGGVVSDVGYTVLYLIVNKHLHSVNAPVGGQFVDKL